MNVIPVSQHIALSRIAELANTSPQNVSNWRKRSTDFPQPVAGTDRRPLFDREEMIRWLKANGSYNDNPEFGTRIWAFMDGLRVSVPPSDALQITLSAVAWKSLSTGPVPGGFTIAGAPISLPEHINAPAEIVTDDEIHVRLGQLVSWAASTLKSPYDEIFDPLTEALPRVGAGFLSTVLPEVLTAPQTPAELESALDNFLTRAKSQDVLGRTSAHLRNLALSLLDIQDRDTVLDAACGSGSFLLHVAANRQETCCIGVDVNEKQLGMAAAAAIINRVSLDLRRGDSITGDPARSVRADSVFVDPPFGLKIHDPGSMQGDPRWIFGMPSINMDFAWLQHGLARLTPEGRAVVVLPAGSLTSGSGRKIRTEFVKQGVLEAVIALPRGTYPGMAIAPTLWVLQGIGKNNGASKNGGVLLVDASNQNVTDPGSLDWISETVDEYRQGIQLSVSRPEAAVVSVIDILSEDANVAPSRWLAESSPIDQHALDAKSQSVQNTMDELKSREMPAPWTVVETTVPFIKVADLVTMKTVAIVRNRRQVTSAILKDSGSIPVLTPSTLRGELSKQQYTDETILTNNFELTRVGDIAVWRETDGIKTVVLTDGGAAPSPHIQILRVQQGSFIPEYLAVCLTSAHNQRFLHGSSIMRPDLQALEVPSVSLNEQHQIRRYIRGLKQLREGAKRANDELAELHSLVSDAIGEGALRAPTHD